MVDHIDVSGRAIAIARRIGATPGLFWLSGFKSDMTGSKALAVDAYGARRGLAVTRFDYSGHGQSGGAFADGTISRWLEEAEAAFAASSGPQIVIGSSMGGWLALLLNRMLRLRGDTRIAALVLIAPATDMTDLMLAQMPPAARARLASEGFVERPSDYGDEPYRITRTLIEDGAGHRLFGATIETGCPVAILQGARDTDVPPEHALRLVEHLLTDPVTFTLVPDAEHRMSRPQDLALLERTLDRLVSELDVSARGPLV